MAKYYILVEGTTDKEILDFFIKNAYPEYEELFYIVPFTQPKRVGGKDYISHIIKAIVHLEQENKKVVTLFDNDTEGIYTKELLLKELTESGIDLNDKYSSIKICSYPNINFLGKYPVYKTKVTSINTIENGDVNQRAASIELYLPTSFLTDKNTNRLFPIRWYSYNDSVNKYQGSLNKNTKRVINLNYILSLITRLIKSIHLISNKLHI